VGSVGEELSRGIRWGVEVLKDMVAIPTVNPPGEKYEDFAKYSKDLLESLGFKVDVIHVPSEYVKKFYPEYASYPRYIVLGRFGEEKPVLHFNGHYDVVPPGVGWGRDPFELVIENGKIFGRGVDDMKGGIAAFLTAIKMFIESGKKLKGSIEVALVPDEEIGGETGTGYIVKELKIRPDYVIIAEPSGSETIWIGHKGALWVLVEVYGKQAHGSTPWLGVNAFEYMVTLAYRLMNRYKPMLDTRRSVYEYDDPRGAKPTITIGGEVRGSIKVNIVPGYYAFSIDRRITPDENMEDVEKEIIEFVKKASADFPPDVRVDIKIINRLPPALINPSSKLVEIAKEAGEEVIGVEPRTTVCLGGLDMRYYTEVGIDTITYGPGVLGTAHTTNEYLTLSEFEKMVQIYYKIIEKFLT
jgi:succinyl-diaminopimelate desuccinylase